MGRSGRTYSAPNHCPCFLVRRPSRGSGSATGGHRFAFSIRRCGGIGFSAGSQFC
ncbi:hypothetical protein [Synechococcus sp. M16CYN]|uniref:hypothetical protein n=1 Tax=Synechococcus sp. M16CYN TaxID=3103139 RepID=UPI003340BBA5